MPKNGTGGKGSRLAPDGSSTHNRTMVTLEEVVRARRSIRAFDPERRVPMTTLREVLALAQRAPSNCNAQPWQTYIVSGPRCEELRAKLTTAARSKAAPEELATPPFQGVERARQVACAIELYRAMGIQRHEAAKRHEAVVRNFEFFDAPHVALLYMDRRFGVSVALDVGAYMQTLLLAFEANGIAACAQASLRSYANLIKESLDVPENLQLLCGISFGYPVSDAPVNDVHQSRASIDESVHFVE